MKFYEIIDYYLLVQFHVVVFPLHTLKQAVGPSALSCKAKNKLHYQPMKT